MLFKMPTAYLYLENKYLRRVCWKSPVGCKLELLAGTWCCPRGRQLTPPVLQQGKMIMQDKLEKERNDAKNAVEECVYEFRGKLCGPYGEFVGEQVSAAPAWTLGPLPGWVASVVETEQLGVEIVSTESGAGGSPAPRRWVPSRFTRVASWFHHPELRTYQTFVQPDVLR